MKKEYLIRLDDACEYRNVLAWDRIEKLLDKYSVKPLVGVIPNCEDEELISYGYDDDFWNLAQSWMNKKWAIALHGYNHVYITDNGGVNPVNRRSEFAGVDKRIQCEKIKKGIEIFEAHSIKPIAFFAPSHTFDQNTLEALKEWTDIKIVSDCVANRIFYENGLYFLPQQTGKPRNLPFRFITICLHPNIMKDSDFEELEEFLQMNFNACVNLSEMQLKKRKRNCYDKLLQKIYFGLRNLKNIGKM